jgi:predicted  nucleic acid-binding Zn-ribbon protein
MEMIDILTLIGGVMLSIIGYFLKNTMNELKEVKTTSFETKNKLALLENDSINKYTNLSGKFDDLKGALVELTKEIKEMNRRIK